MRPLETGLQKHSLLATLKNTLKVSDCAVHSTLFWAQPATQSNASVLWSWQTVSEGGGVRHTVCGCRGVFLNRGPWSGWCSKLDDVNMCHFSHDHKGSCGFCVFSYFEWDVYCKQQETALFFCLWFSASPWKSVILWTSFMLNWGNILSSQYWKFLL